MLTLQLPGAMLTLSAITSLLLVAGFSLYLRRLQTIEGWVGLAGSLMYVTTVAARLFQPPEVQRQDDGTFERIGGWPESIDLILIDLSLFGLLFCALAVLILAYRR